MVGMQLNTPNAFSTFENYFQKLEIPFKNNARFFMMDTINVNSVERKGIKWLLKHLILLSSWVGCGTLKVALCFKHLLPEFKFIFSADETLLALWKFFHFHPLDLGFMEKVADIYGESLVTPICPSTTRWTAHAWACKHLCKGYKQFLHALGVCMNEHSEPKTTRVFNCMFLSCDACILEWIHTLHLAEC